MARNIGAIRNADTARTSISTRRALSSIAEGFQGLGGARTEWKPGGTMHNMHGKRSVKRDLLLSCVGLTRVSILQHMFLFSFYLKKALCQEGKQEDDLNDEAHRQSVGEQDPPCYNSRRCRSKCNHQFSNFGQRCSISSRIKESLHRT